MSDSSKTIAVKYCEPTCCKVHPSRDKMEAEKMKNAKHTPGPWGKTRENSGLMLDGMVGVGPTGANIALVETRHPEWEANARLIAAAPDLLAACQTMIEQLVKLDGFPDLTSPYSGARVAMKAAIAKATGHEA